MLKTSIHILLSVCHQHCVHVFAEMERREEEEEERQTTADSEEEEEGAAAGEADDGDEDEEQTDKDGGDEDEYDDDEDKDVAEMKKKSKEEGGTSCSGRKCVPGIIYLGHIPPRLRPKHLRNLLSVYGEIGRIFLQPEGNVGPENTIRPAEQDPDQLITLIMTSVGSSL